MSDNIPEGYFKREIKCPECDSFLYQKNYYPYLYCKECNKVTAVVSRAAMPDGRAPQHSASDTPVRTDSVTNYLKRINF